MAASQAGLPGAVTGPDGDQRQQPRGRSLATALAGDLTDASETRWISARTAAASAFGTNAALLDYVHSRCPEAVCRGG